MVKSKEVLTDEERSLIVRLVEMDPDNKKKFLKSDKAAAILLKSILSDKEKVNYLKAVSDQEMKKAILTSRAAKAFRDEGDQKRMDIYYKKKDSHMRRKSILDDIIKDGDRSSKSGTRFNPGFELNGASAYLMQDSSGIIAGLHSKKARDPGLAGNKNAVKKKSTDMTNAWYCGYKNAPEINAASKVFALNGLLENAGNNYLGSMINIDESEFNDDFRAIYGGFDENGNPDTSINEGLSTTMSKKECKTIFNVSIKKLMDFSYSEIMADIKEMDNGKTIEDYRINNGDTGLTLNYMLSYIRRMGGAKEKDFLDAKLEYFQRLQDKASKKNSADSFKISFSSVNSVYRRYLKYKNKAKGK